MEKTTTTANTTTAQYKGEPHKKVKERKERKSSNTQVLLSLPTHIKLDPELFNRQKADCRSKWQGIWMTKCKRWISSGHSVGSSGVCSVYSWLTWWGHTFLNVDNTKIFRIINNDEDCVKLQHLEGLKNWTEKWLLSFHPNKSKYKRKTRNEDRTEDIRYIWILKELIRQVYGKITNDWLTFSKPSDWKNQ